jgi:pimeloyl-ACP methyl ester carboxylesterase
VHQDEIVMLPAKGPWPHPYYEVPDAFVEVAFDDEQGHARCVKVRHKALGKGPPLVLVHGLMTSSYSWRFVMEPLAKHYRVLVPDLVGAGHSDKPLDLVYSVANVARFLAAYVRVVTAEPVYLAGNSLGGLYSVRALLDAAVQGRQLARRFVLMHAPGYPAARTRALNMLLGAPVLGSALSGLVARVSHRWPETFVAKNVHYLRDDMMSQEEAAEYGGLFATMNGARVFARILHDSVDPNEHARIIGELRARNAEGLPFPCPTRIVYARKDVMVPAEFGPLYHADIPGSELVWMDDASHFLQVDAPERTVAQLMSFDPDPDPDPGARCAA